jgi:hypothetical protein
LICSSAAEASAAVLAVMIRIALTRTPAIALRRSQPALNGCALIPSHSATHDFGIFPCQGVDAIQRVNVLGQHFPLSRARLRSFRDFQTNTAFRSQAERSESGRPVLENVC